MCCMYWNGPVPDKRVRSRSIRGEEEEGEGRKQTLKFTEQKRYTKTQGKKKKNNQRKQIRTRAARASENGQETDEDEPPRRDRRACNEGGYWAFLTASPIAS